MANTDKVIEIAVKVKDETKDGIDSVNKGLQGVATVSTTSSQSLNGLQASVTTLNGSLSNSASSSNVMASGLQNIATNSTASSTALNTLGGSLTGLSSGASASAQSLNTLGGNVSNIASSTSSGRANIEGLNTSLQGLNTGALSSTQSLGTLNGGIGVVGANTGSTTNAVTALGAGVSALDVNTANASGNIDNFSESIGGVSTNTGNASSAIAVFDSGVGSLSGNTTTATTATDSLTESMGNISSSAGSSSTNMTNLGNAATTLGSGSATAANGMGNLSTGIDNISESVGGSTGAVTNLDGVVATLGTDSEDATGRITVLNTSMGNISTTAGSSSGNITTLDSAVTTLGTDSENATNRLAGLSSSMSSINDSANNSVGVISNIDNSIVNIGSNANMSADRMSDFGGVVAGLGSELETTSQWANLLGEDFTGVSDTSEEANQWLELMGNNAEITSNNMQPLSESTLSLSDAIQGLGDDSEESGQLLTALQSNLDAVAVNSGVSSNNVSDLSEAIAGLGDDTEESGVLMASLTHNQELLTQSGMGLLDQTENTGQAFQDSGELLRALQQDMDASGVAVENLTEELGNVDSSLEETDAATASTSENMQTLAKAGGVAMGALAALAATATAFIFPIAEAAQFEKQMDAVQAISDATAIELEGLSAAARKMGAETMFSAAQAAEALQNLASAGLSVDESIAALPGTLQLAQAGALGLAEAADIATSIMAGYSLEVSELGHINDVLATTANKTNSSVAEMGEAMKYVAPVASAMGVSFEECAAAIGILSNAGVKGSQAGTMLRSALATLAAPTQEASDRLKELAENIGQSSIQTVGADGNFIGLAASLKMLKDTGATAAQVMRLFGQEAGPGMLALLAQGETALRELTNTLDSAEGAAKKMADTMSSNVVGSWDNFTSAVSELSISFGTMFLPAADKVLKIITEITSAVARFVEANKEIVKAITGTTGVVIAGGAALALFGSFITACNVGWTLFTASITASGVLTGLGSTLGAIGVSLTALTATLAVVTAGVVAFVAAFALNDTFREWILGFDVLGADLKSWWELFKSMASDAWGYVEDAFIGGCTRLGAYIVEYFGNLLAAIPIDAIRNKGLEMIASAKAVANGVDSSYAQMHQSSAQLVADKEAEVKAQQDLALATEWVTQADIASGQAADAAVKSRKAGLSDLQDEQAKAIEQLNKHTTTYNSFAKQAGDALAKVSASWESETKEIWGDALSDQITAPYTQAMNDILTNTAEWGDKQVAQVAAIQQRSDLERVSAMSEAATKIDTVYDNELEYIRKVETAKVNLTEGTVKEIAQKEEDLAKKIILASQGVLDKKKEYFGKARDALQTELNKSLQAEEALAQKVIALNEKIRMDKMSGEEKIRALKQSAMSESEAYNDKQRQFNEAMAEGQRLLQTDAAAAETMFKKAQGYAGELVRTGANGVKNVSVAVTSMTAAVDGVSAANQKMLNATNLAATATKEHVGSVKEMYNSASEGYDTVQAKVSKGVNFVITAETKALDDVLVKLADSSKWVANADIKLELVQQKIKEYEAITEGMRANIVTKYDLAITEEVKTFFAKTPDALAKLKEKILLDIKDDGTLDATNKRLAEILGLNKSIGEPIITKIESGQAVTQVEADLAKVFGLTDKLKVPIKITTETDLTGVEKTVSDVLGIIRPIQDDPALHPTITLNTTGLDGTDIFNVITEYNSALATVPVEVKTAVKTEGSLQATTEINTVNTAVTDLQTKGDANVNIKATDEYSVILTNANTALDAYGIRIVESTITAKDDAYAIIEKGKQDIANYAATPGVATLQVNNYAEAVLADVDAKLTALSAKVTEPVLGVKDEATLKVDEIAKKIDEYSRIQGQAVVTLKDGATIVLDPLTGKLIEYSATEWVAPIRATDEASNAIASVTEKATAFGKITAEAALEADNTLVFNKVDGALKEVDKFGRVKGTAILQANDSNVVMAISDTTGKLMVYSETGWETELKADSTDATTKLDSVTRQAAQFNATTASVDLLASDYASQVLAPVVKITNALDGKRVDITAIAATDKAATGLKQVADTATTIEGKKRLDVAANILGNAEKTAPKIKADITGIPTQKNITFTGLESAKQATEDVIIRLDAITDTPFSASVDVGQITKIAIPAISSLIEKLGKIPTEITTVHTIKEVTVKSTTSEGAKTEKKDGGKIYARTGRAIPGYGGGDTVPAMLEPGEWVIRKESVAKYGHDFLADINAGKDISDRLAFAEGGNVVSLDSNSKTMQAVKGAITSATIQALSNVNASKTIASLPPTPTTIMPFRLPDDMPVLAKDIAFINKPIPIATKPSVPIAYNPINNKPLESSPDETIKRLEPDNKTNISKGVTDKPQVLGDKGTGVFADLKTIDMLGNTFEGLKTIDIPDNAFVVNSKPLTETEKSLISTPIDTLKSITAPEELTAQFEKFWNLTKSIQSISNNFGITISDSMAAPNIKAIEKEIARSRSIFDNGQKNQLPSLLEQYKTMGGTAKWHSVFEQMLSYKAANVSRDEAILNLYFLFSGYGQGLANMESQPMYAKGGSPNNFVSAMIEPGEWVIGKESAAKYGDGFMDKINKGVLPVKARTGKKIKGYGGGDTVPAMLEAGEWVINKESVAKYGDGFFSDLNTQKFATGGYIGVWKPTMSTYNKKHKSWIDANPRALISTSNDSVSSGQIGGSRSSTVNLKPVIDAHNNMPVYTSNDPVSSGNIGRSYSAISNLNPVTNTYRAPSYTTSNDSVSSGNIGRSYSVIGNPVIETYSTPTLNGLNSPVEDVELWNSVEEQYQDSFIRDNTKIVTELLKRSDIQKDNRTILETLLQHLKNFNVGATKSDYEAVIDSFVNGEEMLDKMGLLQYCDEIMGYKFGGKINNLVFAKQGKRIAGYGGGDTVPAMLEAGEWVINKESVAKYGDSFMSGVNNQTQQLATGGQVQGFNIGGLVTMFHSMAIPLKKALGGMIPDLSNLTMANPISMPRMGIDIGQTTKHTVNFQFGGKNIGDFTGDKTSIMDLISELQYAQNMA